MICPQVTDGGEDFQKWRVGAIILNHCHTKLQGQAVVWCNPHHLMTVSNLHQYSNLIVYYPVFL